MWKLRPEDRLKAWKDFRTTLGTLPLLDALRQTSELWSRSPFTPYYLDYRNPEEWPDPWTLVHDNRFCDLAKALGMLYTLFLCDHNKELTFEIRIYKDSKDGSEHNIVWLNNGTYILNLRDGDIINTQQQNLQLELIKIIATQELKLD